VIKFLHPYGIAIMELQYSNTGFLQCAEFKGCLNRRTDPHIIVGSDITAPDTQLMHFSIVKIGPLPVIKHQRGIFNMFKQIKGFHAA
jgi:hypothetical protein